MGCFQRSPMRIKFLFVLLCCCLLLLTSFTLAQGDPLPDEKGTVAAAEKKLASDPKNIELIKALGNAKKAVQRINDAIATYGKGLEIDSENVTLLLLRGHAYDNIRQYDLAAATVPFSSGKG